METTIGRRMSEELPKGLKSMRECSSIEDFDLANMELIRGETPEDMKERCLQLCKDYLSGNWIKQTVATIDFRRISGGLTNQLYYCGITEPSITSGVPQEAAIRIYGPKYHQNYQNESNERFSDVVIDLMTSQMKVSAKIYGLFEGGQVLEYIQHRQFRNEEHKDPKLSELVFKKLAQVHAIDVPLKRNSNCVFRLIDNCYETGFKRFAINEMIDELNCQTLKKNNLKEEIVWLKKVIEQCDSPQVLSHNDFRGSNIMVSKNSDGQEVITFCDFEHSCYNYRGIDFGTMAFEWNRNFSQFGRSERLLQLYPSDDTLKTLIGHYIDEMVRIKGQKYAESELNSVDQLLKEVKIFTLVVHMFLILFCIKNDDRIKNEFPIEKKVMMQWAEDCYDGYWYLKHKFIEQNIV